MRTPFSASSETDTMGRRRRQRSNRQTHRPLPAAASGEFDPIWVDVCGRNMFVVGYTSAGFPYGVFEDEMDRDLDAEPVDDMQQLLDSYDPDNRQQPF
jgi:hypothetical protein